MRTGAERPQCETARSGHSVRDAARDNSHAETTTCTDGAAQFRNRRLVTTDHHGLVAQVDCPTSVLAPMRLSSSGDRAFLS